MTILANYDENSGLIQGFYLNRDGVHYDSIPQPVLEITEQEQKNILRDPLHYRIRNGKVLDISDSVEFQMQELTRLYQNSSKRINNALSAMEEALILSVGEYKISYMDSQEYKDQYKQIKADLGTAKKYSIKTYNPITQTTDYVKLTKKKAEAFLLEAEKVISEQKFLFTNEKAQQLHSHLKKIYDSKNLTAMKKFSSGLNTLLDI